MNETTDDSHKVADSISGRRPWQYSLGALSADDSDECSSFACSLGLQSLEARPRSSPAAEDFASAPIVTSLTARGGVFLDSTVDLDYTDANDNDLRLLCENIV